MVSGHAADVIDIPAMDEIKDEIRGCSTDLATMVVPPVGRLVATEDAWQPYRLLDPDGVAVEAVAVFFRDLQAAGRSPATLRSYGLDLLRWFRFLWAAGVVWDRATRTEARDFCRWLLVAGKPARPHWRRQGDAPTRSRAAPTSTVEPYAASVRAHSETVLRSFYDFHHDAGTGPILNPFPWTAHGAASGPTPTTTRWSRTATSGWASTGPPCQPGSRAASPTRRSTSCL